MNQITTTKKSSAPTSAFAALDKFAREMDCLAELHSEVSNACRNIEAGNWVDSKSIQNAQELVEVVRDEWLPELAKLGAMRKALMPPGCSDSGDVPRNKVAKLIAVLVGSFPNGAHADPKVYVTMLIEHVLATKPDYFALESTVREVTRNKKFLPAIHEVLEELTKQKRIWTRRHNARDFLKYDTAKLEKALAQAAIANAERKARQERARLKVGDRVCHPTYGAGTLMICNHQQPYYFVKLDHVCGANGEAVECDSLEKFSPAPLPPLIEHQPAIPVEINHHAEPVPSSEVVMK